MHDPKRSFGSDSKTEPSAITFRCYGTAMTGRALALAAFCTLLAACGSADEQASPAAPTAAERSALDDAAEMLEDKRLPASAIPPTEAASPSGQPSS